MHEDDVSYIPAGALLSTAGLGYIDLGNFLKYNQARNEKSIIGIIRVAGWQQWQKKADRINQLTERWSFSRRDLLETHYLEYWIPLLYKNLMLRKHLKAELLMDARTIAAIVFAKTFIDIYNTLNVAGKTKLKGALLHGLQKNGDLKSLEWELIVASNLATKGYDVAPIDLYSLGRFDFRTRKAGSPAVNCECKSIKKVKGQLQRHRFLDQLYRALEQEHLQEIKQTGHIWQIELSYPSSFHLKNHRDARTVADAITTAINSGVTQYSGDLNVKPTPLERYDGQITEVFEVAEEVDKKTNPDHLAVFGGCSSPFVLAARTSDISSEARSEKIRRVWNRFLRKAINQLPQDSLSILSLQIERGLRATTEKDRERATNERVSIGSLVLTELDKICGNKPTFLGISVSFAGPPFSEGTTAFLRNPHSQFDHPLTEAEPSLPVFPTTSQWFDDWDSCFFSQ